MSFILKKKIKLIIKNCYMLIFLVAKFLCCNKYYLIFFYCFVCIIFHQKLLNLDVLFREKFIMINVYVLII